VQFTEHTILDTGYIIQNILDTRTGYTEYTGHRGYRIKDSGFRIQDIGYRKQNKGYRRKYAHN